MSEDSLTQEIRNRDNELPKYYKSLTREQADRRILLSKYDEAVRDIIDLLDQQVNGDRRAALSAAVDMWRDWFWTDGKPDVEEAAMGVLKFADKFYDWLRGEGKP